MTTTVIIIFLIVYLGMMLGTLPFLKIDRPAIALVGAVALISGHLIRPEQVLACVDFGTLALLFGLMLVSIQLEMSGFYTFIAERICRGTLSPPALLAVLTVLSGGLAAFLTNDVIAVALTPVVLGLCRARRLNPVPFLLTIAFSTNSGAIATFIGCPQNMLISQKLNMGFLEFAAYTAVPAFVSLFIGWGLLVRLYGKSWSLAALPGASSAETDAPVLFDRIEAIKGVIVCVCVVSLFVLSNDNKALVAMTAGAFLLLNARFQSRTMLHRIDWDLLILFFGLFVVNGAMESTGIPNRMVGELGNAGVNLRNPGVLFGATAILSDLVSNVPAVMLLLPYADNPISGPMMAIASGLSSNLIVIGSMANIIVVDAAASQGIKISFRDFCRAGIPLGLLSMLIGVAWVVLMKYMNV
jgi:Na+/H+ antiporter NhaD/arsenite permease-like protein